jgi:hypothetical protein
LRSSNGQVGIERNRTSDAAPASLRGGCRVKTTKKLQIETAKDRDEMIRRT